MNKKVQVWVVHNNEVLLLKLIPERGGGWHPITANVHDDEKLLDCAKRETFEETGISPKKGEWVSLDYSFEYHGRWGEARETVYAVFLKQKNPQIEIDSSEHTDYKWVDINEAEDELSFQPQKEALEKLKCIRLKI